MLGTHSSEYGMPVLAYATPQGLVTEVWAKYEQHLTLLEFSHVNSNACPESAVILMVWQSDLPLSNITI